MTLGVPILLYINKINKNRNLIKQQKGGEECRKYKPPTLHDLFTPKFECIRHIPGDEKSQSAILAHSRRSNCKYNHVTVNKGEPMSSTTFRKSKMNDDAFLTLADAIRTSFIEYKMFFTTFDGKRFTEDYADRVLATLIATSRDTMSDEFFVTSQAKETAEKDAAMKRLRQALKPLEYYVNKRFAGDQALLDEFLLYKAGTGYRNADTLIGFTSDTLVKVAKYKSELYDEGVTDAIIATIESARDDLNTQRREQVEVIRARKVKTKARIENINRLWKELSNMQDAARVLFFDNPEIRELFELPKGKRSKAIEPEEAQEEQPTE